MQNLKCKKLSLNGVTLIELLVSVTVFSVLVGLATAAFVTVLRAQRQALSFASAQENASVVLETMAKEMRTGRNFSIKNSDGTDALSGTGCPAQLVAEPALPPVCTGGFSISFTSRNGQTVTYCQDGNNIKKLVGSGICKDSGQVITARNVAVGGNNLQFWLRGKGLDDGYQPLVTISFSVKSSGITPEQAISVDVGTSVAPRELEL